MPDKVADAYIKWKKCIRNGGLIYFMSDIPYINSGCKVEYQRYKQAISELRDK
jgi:hypothetical protein